MDVYSFPHWPGVTSPVGGVFFRYFALAISFAVHGGSAGVVRPLPGFYTKVRFCCEKKRLCEVFEDKSCQI